jgi:hypothetical protein
MAEDGLSVYFVSSQDMFPGYVINILSLPFKKKKERKGKTGGEREGERQREIKRGKL